MPSLIALLTTLLLSCSVLAEEPSCRESAGADKSAVYVKHCLQVSQATHPPCNAANPCALIISEIKRSCAMFRGSRAPSFCQGYQSN